MIRSGTTTFVDMYYFEDQVAEACDEAGIRCVARLDADRVPRARTTRRSPTRWPTRSASSSAGPAHPRVVRRGRPALHVSRGPGDAEGRPRARRPLPAPRSSSTCRRAPDEQKTVQERYGKTPTEHLRDLGILRKGVLGAHGIWLTDERPRGSCETRRSAIAHCPQSNMKLASGAAPVREMLAEGLRLGLGTDGAASNNDLDMFEEMATAAFLAKHAAGRSHRRPREQGAGDGHPRRRAGAGHGGPHRVAGGRQARGPRRGRTVRAARMHPLYDAVSHLVYAAKGADVRARRGRGPGRDARPRGPDPRRGAVVARGRRRLARTTR